MTVVVFWVSLALCVASFAVFARLTYIATRPAAPARSPAELAPHGLPSAKEVGDLAAAFAKAGPAATAASLCIFFMLVALVASGVITVAAKP